ncbi:TPA: hypothetical protein J1Y36_002876 [Escherichia coli]|nr:hypothetical protein [Escherichia coli]
MKKTLIALALATSAMTSYSAMAVSGGSWGETGHNFELSGNIAINSAQNIWEVFSGVSDDLGTVNITKGAKEVVFTAGHAIPVLGIRSVEVFTGRAGVAPQISYGNGALDLNSFASNKADFTLSVKDKTSGEELGVLKTKLYAGARGSWKTVDGTNSYKSAIYAAKAGDAFYGGAPKTTAGLDTAGLSAGLKDIIPSILDKYDSQGAGKGAPMIWSFTGNTRTYSAYYAAGIQSDEPITVTLNNVPEQDVSWTASLPVTVTYM